MGHDKADKNETPKLGVMGIDFNQVEKALKSKHTNIEKIKYLEWQIEYNGVEKGVDFYSNHSNHSEPIPDFWNGIMYARAGMEDENSENQAYLAGVQAWKDYCQILEIKSNLEQGRPYFIRASQQHEQLDAQAKISFRQLALKLYYEGIDVSEHNEAKFLLPHMNAKRKLYNTQCKLKSDRLERTGEVDSKKSYRDRKHDFLEVIANCKGEAKTKAEGEFKTFEHNNQKHQ